MLTVTADYHGPDAVVGPDQTITAGDTIAFNGSWTDPDGSVSPAGIAWNFNYHFDDQFIPDVVGTLTPSHQFTDPGLYTVALQVTDNHDVAGLSVLGVTVLPRTPYVFLGPDKNLAAGETATLARVVPRR